MASLVEAKIFQLVVNLLELSHNSEDTVRIASLRRISHVKIQLTRLKFISPKRTYKILVQNNLPVTMNGKLANLN